mgnify:CR=1 FL=1
MKINEIIARLEEWQKRLGYSTDQGDLNDIIKDLKAIAKNIPLNQSVIKSVCDECNGTGILWG